MTLDGLPPHRGSAEELALQQAGLTAAAYRDGLYARESQSSTFLGNAIAIPHGTAESRRHVLRTGIRVLQFPAGVEWHDGNLVHVLVSIAAQSDEHLDILRQLTHVLDREGSPHENGEPLAGVACLAAQGDAHRGLLERLVSLLENGSADELASAGAATVLARLRGAGLPQRGITATFITAITATKGGRPVGLPLPFPTFRPTKRRPAGRQAKELSRAKGEARQKKYLRRSRTP